MTVATTLLDALTCGASSCVCAVTARNGYGRVHCPAHKDDRPSLNVSDRDGTTLVHCHAGCAQEAVIAALRDRKLWNGTGPSTTTRSIEATYAYTDEHGAPLFEVVRYRPKGFVQRRPDGHGGWLYHLNGTRRVLFNLPEVRAVAAAGWAVFVVEGEKDAAALIALGLCATTSPHGAGKWRDEYAEYLSGAEVVVIADKDEPGRLHAQSVARSCFGKAKSVKVLELPGDAVKDASDWISAGGTRSELEALAAAALDWTLQTPEMLSAAKSANAPASPARGDRLRRLAPNQAPAWDDSGAPDHSRSYRPAQSGRNGGARQPSSPLPIVCCGEGQVRQPGQLAAQSVGVPRGGKGSRVWAYFPSGTHSPAAKKSDTSDGAE